MVRLIPAWCRKCHNSVPICGCRASPTIIGWPAGYPKKWCERVHERR